MGAARGARGVDERIAVAVCAARIALLLLAAPLASAEDWAIVVHPSRVERLDLARIAQIYLKQRRFWSDGSVIVAINRSAGTPARDGFSRAVFRTDPETQRPYWNRQYFLGVLPPITLGSSRAVLEFVAAEPRAIGYLPARLVDDRVRTALRYQGKDDTDDEGPETRRRPRVDEGLESSDPAPDGGPEDGRN